MTYVGGMFNQQTIRDTRGTTDQQVGGSNNSVRFIGDNGANTFHVGGMRNNVHIQNIGRDESIQLEGRAQDWQQLPDANNRDGKVTMVNRVTGNSVTLETDGGRGDAFVQSKINFTNNYASLANPSQMACAGFGGWNNLGNIAMNPNCFSPSSYMAGYLAGQQAGYSQGANDGFDAGRSQGRREGFWGTWGAIHALPFRAWGLCF